MVILVTRAAKGIGRAAAVQLAAAGHTVYGGASTLSERAQVEKLAGVRAFRLDLTDAASRESALERITHPEGRIDAVVFPASRDIWGPLSFANRVASAMVAQESGILVFAGGGARRGSGPHAVADLVLATVIEVTRRDLRGSGVRVAEVDADLAFRPSTRTEDGVEELASVVTRIVISAGPGGLFDEKDDPTDANDPLATTAPPAPTRAAAPTSAPAAAATRRMTAPRAAPAPVLGMRPGSLKSDPWVDLRSGDSQKDDLADEIDVFDDSPIPMEDESAFDEAADVVQEPAWLQVEDAIPRPLKQAVTRVGRGRQCEIQVSTDAQISRHHFAIVRRGRHYFVEDANTANGTKVDGADVASRRLVGGEVITAGETRFTFKLGSVR